MGHSIRVITTACSAATLCAGGATAQIVVDARADMRVHTSVTTPRAGGGAGTSLRRAADAFTAPGAPIGVASAFGALSRGAVDARGVRTGLRGAPLIEMFDDVESLLLLPNPLQGQQSASAWTNHPVNDGTLNVWLGQAEPFAGVVDTDVDGDASKKVRMFTFDPQAPDQFFAGWTLQLVREHTSPTTFDRLVLQARLGQPVRAGHDAWNDSIDSLWTSEAVHASGGFISTRLLWGGECVEEDNCDFWGLPHGPIDTYHFLGHDGDTTVFYECEFIDKAPIGYDVGDPVNPPIQSWHRIIHELRDDDTARIYIDYLDGDDEYLIAEFDQYMDGQDRLDAVGGNASFESSGDAHYVDNVFASGHEQIVTCPGDVNGDGVVDFTDFSLLLAAYGACTGDGNYNPDADFDDSGCVDFADFSVVLANYGDFC